MEDRAFAHPGRVGHLTQRRGRESHFGKNVQRRVKNL
jgi:hypothetical protein